MIKFVFLSFAFCCFLICVYAGFQRTINLERVELAYVNKSFGEVQVSGGRVSRSQKLMNGTLKLYKDLDPDVMVDVIVYKEDKGVYKETAVQFSRTLCDFLNIEYKTIYADYMKKGCLKHFLKSCPIKKGVYYFRNCPIPSDRYPWLPLWKVSMRMHFYTKNVNLMDVYTYVFIKEE